MNKIVSSCPVPMSNNRVQCQGQQYLSLWQNAPCSLTSCPIVDMMQHLMQHLHPLLIKDLRVEDKQVFYSLGCKFSCNIKYCFLEMICLESIQNRTCQDPWLSSCKRSSNQIASDPTVRNKFLHSSVSSSILLVFMKIYFFHNLDRSKIIELLFLMAVEPF